MKKIYYISTAFALMAVIALPAISSAEDSPMLVDQATTTEQHTSANKPPFRGPGEIRQQITNNLKNNQDARNNRLESFREKTGTTTNPQFIKRSEDNQGDENGTSTENEYKNEREHNKGIRKDIFEMQKKHVAQELNRALSNLTEVRDRIASRITKAESSGRTMTDAKAKLVIADAKIATAQSVVTSFLATSSASTASSTATTTTQDLGKARTALKNAQDAIKDAKKSLNDVIVAIAHAMGLKVGKDGQIIAPTGTSTPPITSTTTPPTSTTTPPTSDTTSTSTATTTTI